MPQRTRHSTREVVATISLVLAAAAIAVGIYITLTDRPTHDGDGVSYSEAGSRGDYWGGHIGAFSTFAGTLLFFGALLLQQEELKAQRDELRATREVASKSEQALREQVRVAEEAATIERILHLSNARRTEIQAAGEHVDWFNHDNEPTFKYEKQLREYARVWDRARAIHQLLKIMLSRPCFTEDQRKLLRRYAELDSYPLPTRPSRALISDIASPEEHSAIELLQGALRERDF